jgi:cell division protein FtsL
MNVQPGRSTTHNRSTSAARKDPGFVTQFCRLLLLLFFLGMIVSVLFVHIFMNQRITETGREIKKTKQDISNINIELSNLKIKYEQSCSYEYIRQQMARFKLPLTSPAPGQVTRMALLSHEQAGRQAARFERGQRRRYTSASRNFRKEQ